MTHPDDHLAAIRAELTAAGTAHERTLNDMIQVVDQIRAEIRSETSHVDQVLRGEGVRFSRSLTTHLQEHGAETALRLDDLTHRIAAIALIHLAVLIAAVSAINAV